MQNLMRRIAVGLTFCLAATAAMAQEYPTKPVRIVVPYGPGTAVDLVARVVAERLTRSLGQSFVIENRAGAAGTIAGAAVASAAPDGYTLLINVSSHTTVPALMKNLSYDPQRDFAAVAIVGESPVVLVTSKARGYQSVKDLVAAAKAKPGSISFASAGVGTTTHLAAEKFRVAAGFTALHVPYKSTTDALGEVVSGRIDYLFTALPAALGLVKDGKLVALAMGSRRSAALPNVPTVAEAGVANAETLTWFGLFAPAKTPRDIVLKLHREIAKVLSGPEAKERFAQIGAEDYVPTLEEFEALLKKEFAESDQLIKSLGIKLE